MSTIGLEIKKLFVDRLLLEKKIDKATAKTAGRAGTILRRDARASIKTKAPTAKQSEKLKSPDPKVRERAAKSIAKKQAERSTPGGPPFARTRDKSRTIRNIQYGYDRRTRSLVAGPVKIGGSKQLGNKTVPEGLEEGARLPITEVNIGSRRKPTWVQRHTKKRSSRVRRRTVRVAARPVMGPAFERKRSEMLQTWDGAVK